MIKFFRRIRQKLLSESRVTKYLIYAVGEIVLVVLGILIALTINNWNTNQRDKQKELDYIRSFIEDVESDISQSELDIESLNRSIANLDTFLLELSSETIYLNSNKAYRKWMGSLAFADFVPNDRTIELLKNSGGFELISLKEASETIWEYDKMVKLFHSQDDIMGYGLADMNAFEHPFDIISLRDSKINQEPVPLINTDKVFLNKVYTNRMLWRIGISGLRFRIQGVQDKGKETIEKLQSLYKL